LFFFQVLDGMNKLEKEQVRKRGLPPLLNL
jgi:hypothetical protein